MQRVTWVAVLAVLAPDAVLAAEGAPVPAPAGPAMTALDAVVVTARHRSENVQAVPLAISVVDGLALERRHATELSSLSSLVPSVTFAAGNELRNNAIRIRGVGTDVFSTGVEPSISTVVDGVVLQRPGAAFSDLVDIERVEVLRGPQGTLFGKNASGGVVNVITRAPDFERRSGNASVLIAADAELRLSGAVSGPLAEGWAYRISGFQRRQEGTVDNLFDGRSLNGQRAHGARAKLAWRSADARTDVLLSADAARLDADCCALPLLRASDSPGARITHTGIGRRNQQVNNDVTPYVRQDNRGASLTANLALGDHMLTGISAWRRFENRSNVDLDDTPGPFILRNANIESSRTLSQEVRLASPVGGRVDYLLGAYYWDGSVYNALDRRGLNLGAVKRIADEQAVLGGHSSVDSRNAAVFAHGNWHATPRLTVGAGVRLIDERLQLRFFRPAAAWFNGAARPATSAAFGPVTGNYRDSAVIGRLSASYAVTPLVMGYASWGSGYKGQGLASTLGLTAAQFAQLPAPAETSRLFEAGLKSTLFDNALMLNLTAFHTRINDYQAQTYNAATGLFLLTSAGEAAIDGVELEFTVRPHAYLSVTGGLTWLDARFNHVPNGPCHARQTAATGCLPAQASAALVQDLRGKPLMNAPTWRYTLSGRYDAPLTARVDAYLQADLRWQDTVVFDISQDPQMVQPAYAIADLSAGLIFAAGRYDLGIFVKNVGDHAYAANIMAVGIAGGANAYAQQLPRDFRRYAGLSFRMNF